MVYRRDREQILKFIKALHEKKYNSARNTLDKIVNNKLKRKLSAHRDINIFN